MPIGLVAAGVGAAGAIGGALISSSAANSATKATTTADSAAIAEEQREFNTTQANEAPWLTTGASALDQLAQTYGLSTAPGTPANSNGTTPAAGTPDYSSFYESPDYQFTLDQGLKGVQASAAANGSLDSGATRKAEIAYSGNLADQNYNQYANRLQALAGAGQTAASTEASAGATSAGQVSDILLSQGNANANAALAKGSSYATAIGQLAGIANGVVQNQGIQPVTSTPPVQLPASGGGY